MATPASIPLPPASLGRRLASLLYESLLAFAIAFIAGLLFYGAASGRLAGLSRHLFQAYIGAVLGLYFVWCWYRGGQTLPMKTWKLRLVRRDGHAISWQLACVRYLLACASVALVGSGFLWAVLDRDGQFLHDRIAGTRIVSTGA